MRVQLYFLPQQLQRNVELSLGVLDTQADNPAGNLAELDKQVVQDMAGSLADTDWAWVSQGNQAEVGMLLFPVVLLPLEPQ